MRTPLDFALLLAVLWYAQRVVRQGRHPIDVFAPLFIGALIGWTLP